MKILPYILAGLLAILICAIAVYCISALLVNPRKEYIHNSRFYRVLINIAAAIGLKLSRVRVNTVGFEKVPKGVRLLFVSNHRSKFDPIITWYVFRKWDIAFISKEENFHIPFFGRIIRKCCFMAIDREDPRKAIKTINNASDLLTKKEVSIGVYPEGTRSKDCELLPFHNCRAAFYTALRRRSRRKLKYPYRYRYL